MIKSWSTVTESPAALGRERPKVCPAVNGLNTATRMQWNGFSFPEHEGMLSIKCAFNGSEMYRTPQAHFTVSDSTYLVLNAGQWYSPMVDYGEMVDGFSVFFRPGFAEEVLGALITPEDRLLDDPEHPACGPVVFFEQLHRHDDVVSPVMLEMRNAIQGGAYSSIWLEEQFHILLQRLLQVHRNVRREIESVSGTKSTTRVERYRRVQRGREFIEAHFNEPIALPEIARAACLSPHHFLRLFKSVFGMTPGQYITMRRIEQARVMLSTTDLSVGSICYDIGFESHGSFSTLFRRTTGMSPLQYRSCRPRVQ